MHDDDFDNDLAQRLRGYESRLPDAGPPGAAVASRTGWQRFALGGAMAALLLVAAVMGVLYVGRDARGVGDATPQPSPMSSSAIASLFPSAAPPSNEPSVSVVPSPSPTPEATQSVPVDWTATGAFIVPGERYVVADMSVWSGGLIAVGTRYASVDREIFGPPPAHRGVVWLSADGTAWEELPASDEFADMELTQVFTTPTGSLMLIGNEWTDVDGLIGVGSKAWESFDGRTWQRTALTGLPDPVWVRDLVQGDHGYLLSDPQRLWWSADGRDWVAVLDFEAAIYNIAAGDEGFAVLGNATTMGRRLAASGDGREWVDAEVPSDELLRIAAIRGDWIAAGTEAAADLVTPLAVQTWRSANALEWRRAGGFTGAAGSPNVSCAESFGEFVTADTLVFGSTIRCGEGGLTNAGMSYASADGVEWQSLPFGEAAAVRDALVVGDRIVVATDALTGVSPTIGVTFWISGGS